MYGFTITHTHVDQRYNNAPDALDALFDYLRGELVDAAEPRTIDWVFHDPDGPFLEGSCGSGGHRDTFVEANLAALHHGIASDLALTLYEASRRDNLPE